MKNFISIGIVIAVIGIGIGVYYYLSSNQSKVQNYEAERTSTENTNQNDNKQIEEVQNQEEQAKLQTEAEAQSQAESPVEEEIAAFSTKIYTKDSSRQNNLTITCNALNDTDIEDGETFSFCHTVGQSSPSKGYKKADVFKDGEKAKGYGGGNCQVSTTLYNAVLEAPGLKVTERHQHSKKVPYIQSGKDAAVAYGSYDLKFVNNSGNTIRIKASNTPDLVSISLVKLL